MDQDSIPQGRGPRVQAQILARLEAQPPRQALRFSLFARRGRSPTLIDHELGDEVEGNGFLGHSLSAISRLHGNDRSTAQHSAAADAEAYQDQITASVLFRDSVNAVMDRNWLIPSCFAVAAALIFHFDVTRKGNESFEFLETMFLLRSAAFLGMQLGPYLMESVLIAALRLQDFKERRSSGMRPLHLPSHCDSIRSTADGQIRM